ncbi:MAG TPA: NAD(P)-binding domain-containing protein, partial [Bacteroidia bacterium]|nr:NAD(P)-binding domain-containing protein [Bacteroidia bacterium]
MNETYNITIIGGGNLGNAIANGLLLKNFCKPAQLTVTKRNIASLKNLAAKGVTITTDNVAAIKQAHVIILAIKPYQMDDMLQLLAPHIDVNTHVLCSVVTGYKMEQMRKITGNIPIIRAMPNTAIAIGQSMTCLCAENASANQQAYIESLFSQLGQAVYIQESLMDAATV